MEKRMVQRPLLIELPSEIASALVEDGFATDAGTRRSSTWQVIVSVATGASTTISLLQGPQTVAYVAEKIKDLFRRKPASKRSGDEFYVEAMGPQGQMRIRVTADTPVEEVVKLLEATVFDSDGQ
jgi:hypothetical protein